MYVYVVLAGRCQSIRPKPVLMPGDVETPKAPFYIFGMSPLSRGLITYKRSPLKAPNLISKRMRGSGLLSSQVQLKKAASPLPGLSFV